MSPSYVKGTRIGCLFRWGNTIIGRNNMSFIFLCVIMHALPPDVLGVLGVLSDHVSDVSPEFIRGIEHIVFTMLLN